MASLVATTLKYNLKQINDISSSGFYFEIPEDVYNKINYLSLQVGSSGLSSPIFTKSEPVNKYDISSNSIGGIKSNNRKRKGNKGMEVSSEDWESIRTFQTTKIEQKSGIDSDIDQLRLFFNKLTDKTFLDMREKIIEKINAVCSIESTQNEDCLKIGYMLYDVCSTNKFYSKIFADLFAELVSRYNWLKSIFDEKYKNIMDQYKDIQYVDSEKDYDGFCDMNKNNEKRKAVTSFLVNLSNNGVISKEGLVKILRDLLSMIIDMIGNSDKKNEVDELTENIAILFNKDLIETVEQNSSNPDELYVSGKSIITTVNSLAKAKAKDYPSLSNKAIFKYMDLIEM